MLDLGNSPLNLLVQSGLSLTSHMYFKTYPGPIANQEIINIFVYRHLDDYAAWIELKAL